MVPFDRLIEFWVLVLRNELPADSVPAGSLSGLPDGHLVFEDEQQSAQVADALCSVQLLLSPGVT